MRSATLIAAAGLIALTAGCSSEPDPLPPQPDEPPAADIEADEAQPEPDDPVVDQDQPGEDELAATWQAFHAAWVEQAALDQPDADAFDGLTTAPEATVETLQALRAGGQLVTTAAELWPTFAIDADRADIVDCAIVTQHPNGQSDSTATVTVSWEATAIVTDDGWLIETAQPGELFCVAEELNDQLLAAYSAWLDGHSDWYEPPDPEHPLLPATMVDPGLTDMQTILADDRDAGISMRFPHATQAVVTDVAPGTARVTDCYEAPDGYGAFDVGSGERRADVIPAPTPGQLNRTVADFDRTEAGWRVVGWRWEEQNDCAPGETRYAPR
jgi:hypothetical protein